MQKWEEVIFEGRNKDYGSFELRRHYYKYLFIGFVCALILVIVPVGVIFYLDQSKLLREEIPFTVSVDLSHPIDIQKLINEPPPPPVKKQERKSEKAIPVVKDTVIERERRPVTTLAKPLVKDTTEVSQHDRSGKGNGIESKNDTSSFLYVDELPEPYGGKGALSMFIRKNFVVPDYNYRKRVKGVIVVQFIISKTGSVEDVKLVSGIDSVMDKEAIRVIRMLPRWVPAKRAGRPVPFRYRIPLNFY